MSNTGDLGIEIAANASISEMPMNTKNNSVLRFIVSSTLISVGNIAIK